jgi:MFS family permease
VTERRVVPLRKSAPPDKAGVDGAKAFDEGDPPPSASAWYALGLLCIINALSYVDRSTLALTLPQLQAELHLSDTILGLVSGLPFGICYALCTVPAARIADNRSRRNLLSLALALWSVCTTLTAAVQTGFQLSAARFLLGASESVGLPTTASMIADLFRKRWRVLAFSGMSASSYLGPLVGFPLIGLVTAHHGWRAAFLAAGIPGVVIAAIFFLTVKEPVRHERGDANNRIDFKTGIRQLVRTRSYLYVVLAGGLSALNQGSLLAWGPSFLSRIHHLDPQQIGQYFGSLRGITGLIGALMAGVLVNALVRRHHMWQIWAPAGFAMLVFVSDAIFLLAPGEIGWKIGLSGSAFLSGATVASSYVLYVNVVKPRLRATAASFYFVVASLLGLMLAPLLVGSVTDLLAGALGIAAISYSMIIASFATVPCGILILIAGRTWAADVVRAESDEEF